MKISQVMTAGWDHQDQFKWSWSRSRADDPCQYNQMYDQPLPLETCFSGVPNMTNGEFQGKFIQFNVVPNFGNTDQWIVSEPMVHEIAPCHIMATPQETGLTAPSHERHIPVHAQEPSPCSRQEHAQQACTSHATTYQYPNSSIMPSQECPNPHITSNPGQIPYLHQTQQQLPPAIERQCIE